MNENELLDRMVERLGAEVKRLAGQVREGTVPLNAVEGVLRQKMWEFGAQALGAMIESADGRLTQGLSVHSRRTRTVVSLFGPLDVTRSRCRVPDGWRYPVDEALGLQGRHGWTVGVQEAVGLLSCECGFGSVRDLLNRLLGLRLGVASVHHVAEEAGRAAEELLAAQRGLGPPSAPSGSSEGGAVVVAMDGCQAPERDGWHEVKVGTVYREAHRGRTAGGRGRVVEKAYVATLENAEGFGREVWETARSQGVERARQVVCMGDGAPWIWNLTAEHFPGALEIVDFYHATEHLWAVGEALWGARERSSATGGWVRHYRRHLRRGRVDLVIGALRRTQDHRPARRSDETRTIVRRNLDYFQENRGRMQYDRYRRLHLPIGTGIVEGACKFVVQSRFKRPGSRWSHDGLTRMLALKLVRLNNRWETLWPHLRHSGFTKT